MIVFRTFLGPYNEQSGVEAKEPPFGMLVPPIALSSLVVFIFFFPNVLGDYVIKPAIFSVYPNITSEMIGTISIWHGFNTELMMTIGIIILGSVLYMYLTYFKKVYIIFPRNISFDTLYNTILDNIDKWANRVTNFYMTGYLRDYLAYVFVFFIIAIGGTFFYLNAFSFTIKTDQPVSIFAWMLATTIVIAGVTILFAKTRLTTILVNGYIGFAIAMFFVLFRAPDLALTQLVVETVTTALF